MGLALATGLVLVLRTPEGWRLEAVYGIGEEERREGETHRGFPKVALRLLGLFGDTLANGRGRLIRAELFLFVLLFLLPGVALLALLGYLSVHHPDLFLLFERRAELPVLLRYGAFFLLFGLIMRLTRLAAYHAAEHKVVHLLERGLPLTLEEARKAPALNPYCGSSLLALAVLLLAGFQALVQGLGYAWNFYLEGIFLILSLLPAYWLRKTPLVLLTYPVQALFLARPKDEELERALRLAREVQKAHGVGA